MSCEMRSMMTAYFFGSSMRMPPICTNSASTSGTFIELIFSTTAGGKVFSMPKMIPIFFMIDYLPQLHALKSDASLVQVLVGSLTTSSTRVEPGSKELRHEKQEHKFSSEDRATSDPLPAARI